MAQTAGLGNGTMADTLRQNSLNQPGQAGAGGTHGPTPPQADLQLGAYYSDNVRRTPVDTTSDTVMTAGMALNAAQRLGQFNYSVSGDVDYLNYAHKTYKGTVFGFLDGMANYAFFPGHFEWVVRESFNELLVDPAMAATPSNLETYNYFTTGPRFLLHFGPQTQLMVQLLYSKLDLLNGGNVDTAGLAAPNLNSTRYGGNAVLAYAVSEAGKLSLNLETQRVLYDRASEKVDFTLSELSVGYTLRFARTTFAAELGATRVSQQGQNPTGLLARLGTTRRISPSSTIELSVSRQTADSAELIRNDFTSVRPGDAPLLVAANDPLVDTTESVGWRFQKPRTEFGLDASHSQERYTQSTSFNNNVSTGSAHFQRRLQPKLSVYLSGSYTKQTYVGGNQLSYTEADVTVALNWYLGKRLTARLEGDRVDRRGGASIQVCKENRVGLRFSYNLLGPQIK